MDLALSYLKRLYASGYFRKGHKACDGVWFADHPACKDDSTWQNAKAFLIENGYLVVEQLPLEQQNDLHPKDQLDAWWFSLTPKGKVVAEGGN